MVFIVKVSRMKYIAINMPTHENFSWNDVLCIKPKYSSATFAPTIEFTSRFSLELCWVFFSSSSLVANRKSVTRIILLKMRMFQRYSVWHERDMLIMSMPSAIVPKPTVNGSNSFRWHFHINAHCSTLFIYFSAFIHFIVAVQCRCVFLFCSVLRL